MVHYTIDTDPRRKVTAILALVALGLSYLPTRLSPALSQKIGPLSALGVFGLLFLIFDLFLWRFIPGADVPNLSGTWVGTLTRGVHPGASEGRTSNITITITQTWTRIDVILKGTRAISRAEAAALFIDNPQHIELCYSYQKRPADGSSRGGAYSNGYTRLRYDKTGDKETLSGRYFSDEHRGGTLNVSRIKPEKK